MVCLWKPNDGSYATDLNHLKKEAFKIKQLAYGYPIPKWWVPEFVKKMNIFSRIFSADNLTGYLYMYWCATFAEQIVCKATSVRITISCTNTPKDSMRLSTKNIRLNLFIFWTTSDEFTWSIEILWLRQQSEFRYQSILDPNQ